MRWFRWDRAFHRGRMSLWLLAAGWIPFWAGSIGVITPAQAQSQFQRLRPEQRKEFADQEYLVWTVAKIPPQPYMNEIYWSRPSAETPKFFSESLVQFVARTFDLTRDNSNGSRAQAWAGGGELTFRPGLSGEGCGVQVPGYPSQP